MLKNLLHKSFLLLSIASVIHIPMFNIARIYIAIWFAFSILFLITYRRVTLNFLNFKWLIFPLFFLLHAVSLLYTNNLSKGFFDLEVKLSFVIIPFLFLLVFQNFHDKLPINKMKRLYIFSLFIIVAFLTLRAFIFYFSDGNISHLYYNELSWKYHPSYLAMYVSLGIIFLIYEWYKNNDKYSHLFLLAILVLLVFLFLLSSKAGILVTFIILVVACFYQFFLEKKIIKSLTLLIIAIVFAYVGIHDNYRFKTIEQSIKTAETNTETSESNAVRLLIWETGLDLLKKYWLFGVGCGDVKDVLMKEYENRNMQGAIEKKLNLHNQFLETWLSLGIFGLLLLLTILFIPFLAALKHNNMSWLLFLLLILGNFMTETMLNTQSGVIFILYFYYFFIVEQKLRMHDTIFTAKNR